VPMRGDGGRDASRRDHPPEHGRRGALQREKSTRGRQTRRAAPMWGGGGARRTEVRRALAPQGREAVGGDASGRRAANGGLLPAARVYLMLHPNRAVCILDEMWEVGVEANLSPATPSWTPTPAGSKTHATCLRNFLCIGLWAGRCSARLEVVVQKIEEIRANVSATQGGAQSKAQVLHGRVQGPDRF
jgi:hypothetical protein